MTNTVNPSPAPTKRRRTTKTAASPVTPPAAPAASTGAPAVVVLTPSQVVTIEELGHLKTHQRVLKKRDEELTAEIKNVLRGSAGGVDEDNVLLASVSDRAGRRAVDLERLERDFPQAYAACVSQGNPSEVLTLHKRTV